MKSVYITALSAVMLIRGMAAESGPPPIDTGVPLPAPPTEDPFAPKPEPKAPVTLPSSKPNSPPSSLAPPSEESLKPLKGEPVTISAQGTSDVVTSPGLGFIDLMQWEALPTSENWKNRWNAPDFGKVSIITAPTVATQLSGGTVLPWRTNPQGIPEVVLRAVVYVPNLKVVKPTATKVAPDSIPVDIRQYVTFYPVKDGWVATASPYYVISGDKDTASTLLGINEGKGNWTAKVGPGGLIVKNFIEGGLAAARAPFVQTFRDDEIQWFLSLDTDVDFYLRPKK